MEFLKRPLKLDLQFFAGDDELIDFPEDGDDKIDDLIDDVDDEDSDADNDPTDKPILDEFGQPVKKDEPAPEPDPQTEPEEPKKVQTPEENARFAEQRRQQELERRLQEELQKRPEYIIAQKLAQRYGTTPEELLSQLQEQELQAQAKEQNVPVEVLKKQQALEQEVHKLKFQQQFAEFQQWDNYLNQMGDYLIATDLENGGFPMLTKEDMQVAKDYMLNTLQRLDIPFEQVVQAVHGAKITKAIRESAEQEALARISGRSKNPLGPQGGKPSPTSTLTDEQRRVAKAMGLTEEQYIANM